MRHRLAKCNCRSKLGKAVGMADMQSPLDCMSRDELIQRVQDLQEELRMGQAFAGLPEVAANDAVLHSMIDDNAGVER